MKLVRSSLVVGVALSLVACEVEVGRWDTDEPSPVDPPRSEWPPPEPPARAPVETTPTREIDRGAELLVVDPQILGGARSHNGVSSAPWSFRAMMERLAGNRVDAPGLVEQWLASFAETRPNVERALLAPWRESSACTARGYAGDTTCALPLEQAPFVLIAVVNRVDLAADPCAPGGEVRFVYNALDAWSRAPIQATFILEFALPRSRTAQQWARAWHDFAAQSADRIAFGAALEGLTREMLDGSDLAALHLRSNELAFAPAADGAWELRDHQLDLRASPRRLRVTPLVETPRESLDGTSELARWLEGGSPLPSAMQAMAARVPVADYGWTVPGVSEAARLGFSANTCNGCHGGDRVTPSGRVRDERLPFQHIAGGSYYQAGGATTVSTYLDNGGDDELQRRAEDIDAILRTDCRAGGGNPGYSVRRLPPPRRAH